MTIADRIKSLREKQGFTQSTLAKRLCVTRSAVNAWEAGISTPSSPLLIELARLFHVSSDYLLGIENTATLDISGLEQEEIQILHSLIQYFKSKKGNAC
ncbi:MAG: helix-turn-helix transcriptional regulator [Lachnospiraceae bacterium]|nr:helix-turn-helix transcriptional regulator [Lachnospiraceae bacterium]